MTKYDFYEENDEESEDQMDIDDVMKQSEKRNERLLYARRKVEMLMERKRLEDLMDDIDWDTLDIN